LELFRIFRKRKITRNRELKRKPANRKWESETNATDARGYKGVLEYFAQAVQVDNQTRAVYIVFFIILGVYERF
jgi:hypothetical protein